MKDKRLAEQLYNVAEVRPQDANRDLLIDLRRKNLQISPITLPENYEARIYTAIEKLVFPSPKYVETDKLLKPGSVIYVKNEYNFNKMMADIKDLNSIISVDFEFHQEHSYDGK